MRVIDFRTSGYFSGTIIFLGILLVFVGLLVVLKSVIVGAITLLLSAIIFTTHYRLRINFETKVFHDYVWILGMKHGDKRKFENIEYLFIKKSKVSQKMNMRVASTTIQKDVYDGYLKFSEQEKLHLITKDNKNDLTKKLKEISAKLNVSVVDYTESEPRTI